MSGKRRRTADGAAPGGGGSRQQRARMASMAITRKYPYSEYGRIMHKRGTEAGIARFGDTYRSASQSQRANRKAAGYYGRGGYIGRSLGRWAGSKIGAGDIGSKVGDWVGDKVWDGAKGWLGLGMYEGQGCYDELGRPLPTTSKNALVSGSNRAPPMFGSVQDETGALIVSHREYIGDVFGPDEKSRNFKNRVYDLNPGMEQTFPWLSQIAQNYEEYEFGQLVFEFKSTVNPSVAGDGQMGTIVQVTNYNSGTRAFDDKNTMMHYDGSQSCRSTQHACHGVECDPSKISGSPGHYIRTGPMPDEDIKSYDHGKYQIATVGMPSNFDNEPIGELWVYYTVKLRKPRLYSGKGLNLSRDLFLLNQAAGANTVLSKQCVVAQHANNSLGCKLEWRRCFSATGSTSGIAGKDLATYRLTFPAAYSGNLQITLNICGFIHDDFSSSTSDATDAAWQESRRIGFTDSDATTKLETLPDCTVKDSDGNYTDNESIWATADADVGRKTGNITPLYDMFGAFPGAITVDSTDSTTNLSYPGPLLEPQFSRFCFSENSHSGYHDTFIQTIHVKVGVATGGIDNSIFVNIPAVRDASVAAGTADRVLQAHLEICEYNTYDAAPKGRGVAAGKYVETITKAPVDPAASW